MTAHGQPAAGTRMPTPVPPGKFAEYAACLAEGFCPSCRGGLHPAWRLRPGITWAWCQRCECRWEHNRAGVCPQIGWRARVGEYEWDVITNDVDLVFGATMFTE